VLLDVVAQTTAFGPERVFARRAHVKIANFG
jgi:hypothetical protein